MKLEKQLITFICVFVSAMLILQLTGCGTLIYPERRGQRGGRIDPGIAILDAVGLFFFIVPGLVAFGVDFTTGAIYLPGGPRRSVVSKTYPMRVVRIDPKDLNDRTIEAVVKEEIGGSTPFRLRDADVSVLDSTDQIARKLAELTQSGFRTK